MSEDRLNQIEQRLVFIKQSLSGEIDSFRDETRKRLTKLEHGQSQIKASLDVILRHITGMGQR
jgi:hypothetical protein